MRRPAAAARAARHRAAHDAHALRRHFARDMQNVADQLMTDKDIAAAERLDGTNTADLNNTRPDGYFAAS